MVVRVQRSRAGSSHDQNIRKTWIDIYARVILIATIEGWLYKRIQAYIEVGRACSL